MLSQVMEFPTPSLETISLTCRVGWPPIGKQSTIAITTTIIFQVYQREWPNGIKFNTTPSATRLYRTSYSLEYYPRSRINSIVWGRKPYQFGEIKRNITDPVVQISNPLIDGGVKIPGFNVGFKGEAPDLGAFEVGFAPLEFGRRAYLQHDEDWPAWEQ